MKQTIPNTSLFILIDPEKESDHSLWEEKAKNIEQNQKITGVFLGGSTLSNDYGKSIIETFKSISEKPIVGFPGSAQQVYPGLDAILFLNYLNSDSKVFARQAPIKAAKEIEEKNIRSIPCAYIIINKKSESTTLKVTNSTAFHPEKDFEEIMDRISFAWHAGQRHLYLEAGSGSDSSIGIDILKKVQSKFDFHIIVGGGIKTKHNVDAYYKAGANTVVIGTAVETQPDLLKAL
jgi:putative glycerol-1-phosphate prenyltransferase